MTELYPRSNRTTRACSTSATATWSTERNCSSTTTPGTGVATSSAPGWSKLWPSSPAA